MKTSAKIRLLVAIVLGATLVILLLLYTLKLIEPKSNPKDVFASNITDHQVTISWTTPKPTKGEIIVSEDGNFPLLPILAKQVFKDDGESNLKRSGFYTTHKVTIGNLEPGKSYQYQIYQGWKKVYKGSFNTGSTIASISVPNPVYGLVLNSDKTPVVGALVYLQVSDASSSSSLLSTITNQEGRWSMDLGNLRIGSPSAERVIVDTGVSRVKAETTTGKDSPWPDIILR